MPKAFHRPVLLFVPPPLLYAGVFAVGWGVQHIRPLAIFSTGSALGSWLGSILLIAGLLLALGSLGLLRALRTTVVPHGQPTQLATSGPYRVTRNPMYVSLTIMYLGGTIVINSYWSLMLGVIPLFILNQIVIPYEEAQMKKVFGLAYESYIRHVRRWM